MYHAAPAGSPAYQQLRSNVDIFSTAPHSPYRDLIERETHRYHIPLEIRFRNLPPLRRKFAMVITEITTELRTLW